MISSKPVDLGYRPRQWQRECHLAMERFTVLALHRRAGKTELALMELIDKALRFAGDLGFFVYIAPELKQAKSNAWARLKARLEPLRVAGGVEVSESDLAVTFPHNGAVLRIFGADNPDALRGLRIDGIVIDEVAQIKPELWTSVVRPALGDRRGWALFIGTPKGVNLFSKLYFDAKTLSGWFSASYTYRDTDALLPGEVASMRETMSEMEFNREMLCDFNASGDDQVISLREAQDAAERELQPGSVDHAPVILGVDPARFGDDRTVIYRRQGLQAFTPDVFNGIDNMHLAGILTQRIEEHRPDAVFIDGGGGAGVIDRLRQLGHDVIEVNFGGKSSSPDYLNKRAEMWFAMRDWLRAGGAIPDRVDLKQDLGKPIYKFDAANRIVLEPKADIKRRGMSSPDEADALCLTFAHPVGKRHPFARPTRAMDYDPLASFDRFHSGVPRDYDPLNFSR